MQRNILLVVVSIMLIALAGLLIFSQIRSQREAQRLSSPSTELQKRIQEIQSNPRIPEAAKQQIIQQLQIRQGMGQYMAPQQPQPSQTK
jgi:Tfp pilus assembly protein PilN